MLNRVCLIGRLTRDPELKYTTNGTAVASMSIAVQRFTKNDSGDYDVDFFNVTAWKRTAEFAQNYLGKGRLVSIDGRLQTRSWVDQASGQKRSVVEIVADNMEGLDRKPEGEAGEPTGPTQTAGKPAPATKPAAGNDDIDESSDPFADE